MPIPPQPATFTNPPNNNWLLTLLGIPQNNTGTAAAGMAQGGFGSMYGLGSAPPPIPGMTPTPIQSSGLATAPGTLQTGATQKPTVPKYGLGAAPPPIPGLQPTQPSSIGTNNREAQRNARYSRPAPPPTGPQVSGTTFGNTGQVDPYTGQAVVSGAFSTQDGMQTPVFVTTPSGVSINPAQSYTNYQVASEAAAAGMNYDEYKQELLNSGYTEFGGMMVYNPTGGAEGAAGGQPDNRPWWQQEGFASEKKANQYYTDKKRRERDASKKRNPNRPNQGGKKNKSGGALETATSIMGTG